MRSTDLSLEIIEVGKLVATLGTCLNNNKYRIRKPRVQEILRRLHRIDSDPCPHPGDFCIAPSVEGRWDRITKTKNETSHPFVNSLHEVRRPEFVTFTPSHSAIPPDQNFEWAPDESYSASNAMAGPSCGYEPQPSPTMTAAQPTEPWVWGFDWASDESYGTSNAVAGPSFTYEAQLQPTMMATQPIEGPVGPQVSDFGLAPHESHGSSNLLSGLSFGYDEWLPLTTTATRPIEGSVSHGPWYGVMYQPEPIDLPPTIEVSQDTTHIPSPTLGTMQVLPNSSSVYDPAIQERDEQTDPPQFADFVSLSSSSGRMASPVITTLASASNLTHEEVPSHKGKPQRRASRSQRPAKVKGGRHPGPHTPTRAPRIKLRGDELDIAEKIRDQLLEECRRCNGHQVTPADRIECGPCYRRRLDGGQKSDWQYIRPELNALVLASTTDARMPPDKQRISKNVDLIPDGFKEPKKGLVAHMEAMRDRPQGVVPLRNGVPRPWRVTRTNGIVVDR